MVRFILSLIVSLVVAYPSVSEGAFLPDGIAVMGPTDCCCAGDQVDEQETSAQLSASCCCELQNVPAKLSPRPPALLIYAPSFDFVAPAVLDSDFSPFFTGERERFVTLQRARAPPPRISLLAQQTSFLL